ncbi:hypothetical protein BaRGS_00018737, partial [Batillaria attramentaria]
MTHRTGVQTLTSQHDGETEDGEVLTNDCSVFPQAADWSPSVFRLTDVGLLGEGTTALNGVNYSHMERRVLLYMPVFFFMVCSCSARAQTKPPNQRLLLILMDGLRYDYLNQSGLPLPGFRKIVERGAKPDALIPDFPTLSYPNYYSIMT